MKIFVSILFLFGLGSCFGQGANPFDIPNKDKDRVEQLPPPQSIMGPPDTSIVDSLSAAPKAIITNQNPFDIGVRSSSVPPRVSQQPRTSLSERTPSSPHDTKVVALVYTLAMLIILTLAISMDKKRFNSMLQSCINSNNLRTLYRDNKAWTNGQSIILYIFFFLNFAFIIWFLDIKLNEKPLFNLFWISGAVVLCYFVRHFVMWSMAVIFPLGQEVGLHNFSISLHNMVLGVFLLPFIAALEFMPSISYITQLYAILAVVLIVYLMRQIKGVLLGIGMRGFNPFYFFIYLCAVEIAPILVGYKMMIGAL